MNDILAIVDRSRGAVRVATPGSGGRTPAAHETSHAVLRAFGRGALARNGSSEVLRQAGRPAPFLSRDGTVSLVYDGHIDNLDEIATLVRFRSGARPPEGDLLMLAYETWGEDFPKRLVGDFVVVIWDEGRRRLIGVRDHLGARALFFTLTPGGIVAGSNLREIAAHAPTPGEPDDAFLLAVLAGKDPGETATPYQAVQVLPRAGLLVYGESGVRVRRYWSPSGIPTLRYRRELDYGEHVAHVFGRVVSDKMRGTGSVGVTLSGGLDSSMVAAATRQVGSVPGYMFYAPAYPEMDERPYARSAATALQLELREIGLDAQQSPIPDFPTDPCTPPQWPAWQRMLEAAAADGVSVLLTGDGGDDLFTGSLDSLADQMIRLQLVTVWRRLREWQRVAGASRRRTFVRHALRPLLPKLLAARIGRSAIQRPDWVRPALTDRTVAGVSGLLDQIAPLAFRRQTLPRAGYPLRGPDVWLNRHIAAPLDIELRHPFWDVRLVELALAIPNDVHLRPGRTKAVMRAALQTRLPSLVVERRSKAAWDPILNAWLEGAGRRQVEDLLDRPLLAERGLVDPVQLRAFWRLLTDGERACEPRFWSTLAAEHWLRAEKLGGSRVTASSLLCAV